MATLKTKAISQSRFVNRYEIISYLYEYGINLESVEFTVLENHCEAYGVVQYQIIEVSEEFYNKNIESIKIYLKKHQTNELRTKIN